MHAVAERLMPCAVLRHAVGTIVGIAVGGVVLIAAVPAAVAYRRHRRRKMSAAPAVPPPDQAQQTAPKLAEASAAVGLVATSMVEVPEEAATSTSAIAVTDIRQPAESGAA